jgi:glycosyltransferase involved in cell wall biosynthesis
MVSAGIGDTSALVEEERVGVVVADLDDPSELREKLAALLDRPPDRDRVAEVARRRLARDRFLDVYRRVYAVLEAEARAGAAE